MFAIARSKTHFISMEKRLEQLPKLSKETLPETRKYFKMLKKRTPKNLDVVMKELHEDEFKKTDCLSCGNCCKTTSPIFIEKDIQRISKHLKMKERNFIDQYLERDQDDFMVYAQHHVLSLMLLIILVLSMMLDQRLVQNTLIPIERSLFRLQI